MERRRLAASRWLCGTRERSRPGSTPRETSRAAEPVIVEWMESGSKRLADERKTGRDKLLEDLALQRIPAEVARNGLEMLSWGDRALHHAWRLAESLRIAAGGQSTAVLSATHDRGGSR